MKRSLILLSIAIVPFFTNAQYNCTYKTLEDFLVNSPASEIPPTFRYERQRHCGKVRAVKVAAHRFKGPKNQKLPKGKVFAVYMDGLLFVNPNRPRLRKVTDFFKVEWIGDYGYFVDIQDYPVWMNESYMEDTLIKERLIDRNSGRIIELSKRNLRTILQDSPQLLKDFENEKQKRRKMKEYLVLHQQQDEKHLPDESS